MEKRPLYSAINKYGIEHFKIEKIEECGIDILSEREIYWIDYYHSYHNGYNATKGGDGKTRCDYDVVYNMYLQGYTKKKIIEQTGYDSQTCQKIIESFTGDPYAFINRSLSQTRRKVRQIDPETNLVLHTYNSVTEAGVAMVGHRSNVISRAASGKIKKAFGYKWEFI